MYFTTILPFRTPLSWPLAMGLHAGTFLAALLELSLSRFLFRLKALLYWLLLCLAYLVALLVLFICTSRWEYRVLDWTNHGGDGLTKAVAAWVAGPICLGPVCFLLAALVQYLRDDCQRGIFTEPRVIGSRAAARRAAQSQLERADFVSGELKSYAAATHAVSMDGLPASASSANLLAPVMTSRSSFQVASNHASPASSSAASAAAGGSGHRYPPQLDWPATPPEQRNRVARPRQGSLNTVSAFDYEPLPSPAQLQQHIDAAATPAQPPPGYLGRTWGWMRSWYA